MLVTLVFFAGIAALLLLMGWAGAESRPGFINPNKKYPPFVTAPIRLDQDQEPR